MHIKGREGGKEGKTRRNLPDDDVMIDIHSCKDRPFAVHGNQNSGIVWHRN